MAKQNLITKTPESEELLPNILYEIRQLKRPAEELIRDDVDLRSDLKVSKRTTAYWREKRMITFSKLGGKIYYIWSNVLLMIKEHETPAISSNLKTSL